MESLLENPVRAVLYLKELTAIVQNQQSLIHTQRQRIDELERRLDELSTENRSLRGQQQRQPAPAEPPAAPAEPPQGPPPEQPPPPPGQPEPLQHHQQLPAQPPPPAGKAHPPPQPHQHPAEKDGRDKGCCAALLQHKTPQAIGKGVLSRRAENETVLHQFCCPAADAEQKPSSPDSSSRWGDGKEKEVTEEETMEISVVLQSDMGFLHVRSYMYNAVRKAKE
ncbi:IQ motif and SEC7 domain-containing protein 3-like [Aphelocoma coerulescens]|uniref:IQ motif and SEC7 domain-containing protein 3-like n=1 Tax=Aphelocoma coerulescens TaxID=39617 RepID=UPI003605199B